MTNKRRTFNDNLMLEVVKLIKDEGLSLSQFCHNLNTGDTAVPR